MSVQTNERGKKERRNSKEDYPPKALSSTNFARNHESKLIKQSTRSKLKTKGLVLVHFTVHIKKKRYHKQIDHQEREPSPFRFRAPTHQKPQPNRPIPVP